MTDEEFEAGVDRIIATVPRGHAAHRALDMLWTRYAIERGGPIGRATAKWMAAIEGDHAEGQPYPLKRDYRLWTTTEIRRVAALRHAGRSRSQIAAEVGRSVPSVKACLGRHLVNLGRPA